MKRIPIFLILVLIFLMYGILIFQPIEFLLEYFLLDDSFYYFKTASNIAQGLGPTFDGKNPTNGYHPLWMGISVIVYYLFPGTTIVPIKIMIFLSLLLFFGTTLLLRTLLLHIIQDKFVSAALVFLYAVNPWNVSFYFNGLETPLALFLFVLVLWIFFVTLDNNSVSLRFFAALGVVSGLMILARLDYAMFVLPLFVFLCFRFKQIFHKNIILFVTPVFFLTAPWFVYNYLYFGSLVPGSGLAYTLINHQLFFYKPRSVFRIVLWSLHNLVGTSIFHLNTIGIPLVYSIKKLNQFAVSLGGIFLAITIAMAYFYRFYRGEVKEFLRNLVASRILPVVGIFLAGHALLVFIHGALRWSSRPWYFAEFPVLVWVFLGIALSLVSWDKRKRAVVLVIAIALFASYTYSWITLFPQYTNQLEMYRVALWVRENVESNARIASFNSGIHGYFTNRFLMNADGLINNAAYKAMRENRLWEFFEREHIDYILDYDIVLSYRYKSFFGISDPLARVQKIDLSQHIGISGSYGGSHVNLYKIVHD